jgi:3-oxoacyl-ACP reductase-like protein
MLRGRLTAPTLEEKMSIFGSIASAIFGSAQAAPPSPAAGSATAQSAPPAARSAAGAPATASATGAAPSMTQADVVAMIAKLPGAQSREYNWKQSIVDLMKLLNLDSSLDARKQLAKELGYTGALDGSAEMNVWLHKQVMVQLAKGGGQVPESLKHAS